MVSESSWNRTEAATEELKQCAVSVKPHAITLRCNSPAMVPPPRSTATLCAVGVALTLGSTAAAGVDPDEGDAVPAWQTSSASEHRLHPK